MSHAYAARGARQTAILAAIVGLHYAVFLAVKTVRIVLDPPPAEPPPIVWPEPPKPEPREAPPQPGPMGGYTPDKYAEPDVQLPDFTDKRLPIELVGAGVTGEGAGAGPTTVYVPPSLRTRKANVEAAINSCYPAASRRMNEEGKVVALITIGPSGSAVNWSVAQSSGFARLDAAIGCVLGKLDFVAGRRDGQAVSAEATLPITFQLH